MDKKRTYIDKFVLQKKALIDISNTWHFSMNKSTIRVGGGGEGEGGTHILRHKAYWDVLPKWVSFSSKIFRQGYHFSQKNP